MPDNAATRTRTTTIQPDVEIVDLPPPRTGFDEFEEEVTVEIPRETMRAVIYGEGHAPWGPDRMTRDMGPVGAGDLSDGIPVVYV